MRPRLALAGAVAVCGLLGSGAADAGTCVERSSGGFLRPHAKVCAAKDGCIVYEDTGSTAHAGDPLCVPGWCVLESPLYDVCVATANCSVVVQPATEPGTCVP